MLTIASSSSGNCLLVRNDSVILLIDMGISLSHLKFALNHYKINIDEIDGVIITHEHNDHVAGLKTLVDKHHIPVYAHNKTLSCLNKRYKLGDIKHYEIDEAGFSVKSVDIQPFRTRHDAIYPLGYTFSDKSGKIGVSTDLGCVTPGVINNLKGSAIVFIESNHDMKMLIKGDYPEYLKKRILSSEGHLSNESCAETVLRLFISGTTSFVLGHLSEHNNTDRLAYAMTAEILFNNGIQTGKDVYLDIAGKNMRYNSYTVNCPVKSYNAL
jgi:phosphoribosyl 1,2-cyclic phosphodiesterase